MTTCCVEAGGELRCIVCEIATPIPVPSRVLLIPWGDVQSASGNFKVDDESARLIAAQLSERRVEIPIDYEHQTLGGEFASPDGTAPAAGWIKGLDIQLGVGIFGRVNWTPRGGSAVATREYRYLSPVVWVRKSDGKAIGLHSVALTNKPAIAGMSAIVNSSRTGEYAKQHVVDFRTDPIIANRERFNPSRMGEYMGIAEYAKQHGVSFDKAFADCRPDPIIANRERFNPSRMGEYTRIAEYAKQHGVSFEKAVADCSANPIGVNG